jgi:serine/threonine-protein kinase HipA
MLERFDREQARDGYLRFGVVSGLTVLDCGDSHLDRDRWSYPLLADNVRRWSDRPAADCAELFRRMVFNAVVTNNDDHPRNHALVRRDKGWRLSPAYDIVPTPLVSLERRDLALTVGTFGRTASIYNLVSDAGRFGLTAPEARAEIDRIVAAARNWRDVFRADGVSAADIDYIAPAMLPECLFPGDETRRVSARGVHAGSTLASHFAAGSVPVVSAAMREATSASRPTAFAHVIA